MMIGFSLRRWVLLLGLGALCVPGTARAQDAAELIVRLNRLEGQLRQLSGQVEQVGHENRQLKEQLRKFAEDTEFRFQDLQKGSRAAPAPAPAAKPAKRSDAFDPDDAPAAAGAPKPLGGGSGGRDGIASIIEGERPAAKPQPSGPDPRSVAGLNPDFAKTARADATGSAPASGARGQYDAAYASLNQRRYAEAETGFRDFIRGNPKDKLAADATFYLGESFLRQNKPKEAAQQFLKVAQEHGKSSRAPEAMLKLGTSLHSLGAKEQACATLAELARKYPDAAASVKQGAEREAKKAGCAG